MSLGLSQRVKIDQRLESRKKTLEPKIERLTRVRFKKLRKEESARLKKAKSKKK